MSTTKEKDYYAEQGLPEAVMPACPIVKHLYGQKALVTGANSGIGRAIAIALGHAGADVVVNYVSREEEAAKVAEEVHRCGSKALAIRADVSKEDEVKAMFARMQDAFGAVDIVVNN